MNSQPKPSRQEVIVMLLDGVARVGRSAKNLSAQQWDEPCCGRWTAAETARHLLSLARAHHRWLDAAISGDTSISHSVQELDPESYAAIEFLSETTGPEAISEFVRTAGRYANRVPDHWDTPIGFPDGVITAGQHCALIALDYHLHAWDLAQMNGDTRYEPTRVKQLLTAVGEARAVRASSVDAFKILTTSWIRHRYQAWRYLLSASGRTPSRHSRLSRAVESFKDTMPTVTIPRRRKLKSGDQDSVATTRPDPAHSEPVIDLRGDRELPLPTTDRTGISTD